MTLMPLDHLFLIAAIFLAAGTIKGAIGIGLPTVAISLMAQFLDPRTAISLVLFPIVVSNFYQFVEAGQVRVRLHRYMPFAASLMAMLLVVSYLTLQISSQTVVLVLGIVIVFFTLITLLSNVPQIPPKYDRLAQITAGGVGGILGGLTAIWSPPMLIYFVARRTEKSEFIPATGMLLFLGGLPLIVTYWNGGLLNPRLFIISAMMLVPTFLGFYVGGFVRNKLNAERFRTVVLLFFMLMGLNLIRRVVMG